MTRSFLTSKLLRLTAIATVLGASLAAAPGALADHDRDPCRRPGWEYREAERQRGEIDGRRAGYHAGYEAGFHGRPLSCGCTIDLGRFSYAYQRGFQSAWECAYRDGYAAGVHARQCGGHYGHGFMTEDYKPLEYTQRDVGHTPIGHSGYDVPPGHSSNRDRGIGVGLGDKARVHVRFD